MPPFIPRKRRHSSPLQQPPPPNLLKGGSHFEVLDEPRAAGTSQENRTFIRGLNGSDTDSSLSDVDSSNLEGILSTQALTLASDEEDEEINWEDAITPNRAQTGLPSAAVSGDLELTIGAMVTTDPVTNSCNKKKGPSKTERHIRISTHCMHVQLLLFHNLIRSGWACDKMVHEILLIQLPAVEQKEVEKWRRASGIGIEVHPESSQILTRPRVWGPNDKSTEDDRNQRDWGRLAERQENGIPNMSHGDPTIHLLRVLAAYWRKRFRITSPGLRKHGYKSLELLETEITSFKRDQHDPEQHGERLNDIRDFRDHAKSCEGSRDVGVQLFTALVRGIGIEARLVASLQPVGFGWGKGDEAAVKKKRIFEDLGQEGIDPSMSNTCSTIQATEEDAQFQMKSSISESSGKMRGGMVKRGNDASINLAFHTSSGDNNDEDKNNCFASVIKITQSSMQKDYDKHYDQDQSFPTYWVEAVSPISKEIISVDPFITSPPVATSQDHLAAFESRGTKASRIKQVFAYVIAYSPDGTAKDVTTRYLKKHMWPGSTKGVRLPIERVPVYNRKGKIKRHEDFDWFKTVMSGYSRTDIMRTVVDDLEEAKDLKALKRDKAARENAETLQSYKMSAEFVLERHLRREEAILSGSKPVRNFLAGKGKNAKEEPVYKRSQVAVCRTAESWHKEGRQIKARVDPIKMVPVRAVTLTRKREVEEAERAGGGKLKQGMYSLDQTDWIIPPPIENGLIPKNAYGNMDCFVDSMVPKGASHIPLKSTTKICKRLNIDYAEACVGFEFGMQRAVPVIIGVVVASEHENLVIDEWKKDEEERRMRDEGKREKAALATWRKMLMGLRILKKVREDYGDADANANTKEAMNPFTNMSRKALLHQVEMPPTPMVENPPQYVEDIARSIVSNYSGEINNGEDGGGFLSGAGQHSSFGEESAFSNEGGFSIEDTDTINEQIVLHCETQAGNKKNPIGSNEELSNRQKRLKRGGKTSKADYFVKSKDGHCAAKKIQSSEYQEKCLDEKDDSDKDSNTFPNPTTVMTKITPRAASKRIAARNSEKAVRSHYFAQDGDGGKAGVMESSVCEGITYQPPLKRLRLRPAKHEKRKKGD